MEDFVEFPRSVGACLVLDGVVKILLFEPFEPVIDSFSLDIEPLGKVRLGNPVFVRNRRHQPLSRRFLVRLIECFLEIVDSGVLQTLHHRLVSTLSNFSNGYYNLDAFSRCPSSEILVELRLP